MVSRLGVYYGDDFISHDDDEADDEDDDDQVHPEFQRFGDEHVAERSYDEDADEDENKEQLKIGVRGDKQCDENPECDDENDFL